MKFKATLDTKNKKRGLINVILKKVSKKEKGIVLESDFLINLTNSVWSCPVNEIDLSITTSADTTKILYHEVIELDKLNHQRCPFAEIKYTKEMVFEEKDDFVDFILVVIGAYKGGICSRITIQKQSSIELFGRFLNITINKKDILIEQTLNKHKIGKCLQLSKVPSR